MGGASTDLPMLGVGTPMDAQLMLPLIDMAQWSTNLPVRPLPGDVLDLARPTGPRPPPPPHRDSSRSARSITAAPPPPPFRLPLFAHAVVHCLPPQVKRDAVAGLASLAKSEANKPLMGSTGALEALVQLAFTSEDNPTTLLTDVPKAAKTPGAVYKPRSPGSISPGTARRVGGGFVDDHRLTRRRRGFDETAAEGPAAFSTLAIEADPDPDPDPSEPEPEPEPEKNAPGSPAPAAAAPSSPAAATPPASRSPTTRTRTRTRMRQAALLAALLRSARWATWW